MSENPLITFLRARLDELEAAALAWPEDERRWKVVGDRRLTYKSGSWENVTAVDVSGMPCLWWERIYVKADRDGLSEHLALHDPARVLADIASKRAMLDEHPAAEGWQLTGSRGPVCGTCASGTSDGDIEGDRYPCRTIRLLAEPFASHPDYPREQHDREV
ncbi:DUF6221 family protein [Microbispora amethystogenes]|uniref:DUF6221 family protein n=1 Tax=Microbispora amethystogenes TaxID=1427754 RepID=UPI0033DF5138